MAHERSEWNKTEGILLVAHNIFFAILSIVPIVMPPNENSKIHRILELSEENNKMLKKIVRSMRWARLVRVIYIIIIVGASVGAFYFAQPYINQAVDTYGNIQTTVDGLNNNIRSFIP